jgi:hypothetical protein
LPIAAWSMISEYLRVWGKSNVNPNMTQIG